MVADKIGVVAVHETKGAVVNRITEDGHIIGVHNAMGKSNGLPFGDRLRGLYHRVLKQFPVSLYISFGGWKMPFEHIIGECL